MPTEEIKTMALSANPESGLTSVLIFAENTGDIADIQAYLFRQGFICSVTGGYNDNILDRILEKNIDIILAAENKLPYVLRRIKPEKPVPVIGLIGKYSLNKSLIDANLDDFVLEPFNLEEIGMRIKRLLTENGKVETGLLAAGDLKIDPVKCEVSIAGVEVFLTFKEYELLKFLVNNRGRVFTREALLNKVWGFDYFGGDRTVDVHIRRLRGKIEDANHSFIDTVRSIGYRFKEDFK